MEPNEPRAKSAKGEGPLVAALATGMSLVDAARTAGVSHSTAKRRMKEPDFRRAVSDARTAILDQATGALADALSDAVTTLKRNLSVGMPQVEVRAAVAIISLALTVRDQGELAARIAVIEERIKSHDERE